MPSVEKIFNANIYINDGNFIGRAEEIDVVKVENRVTEHETLGMVGPLELFEGVEKLEARILWKSFNLEVLQLANPIKGVKLLARAAQQVYEDSSVTTTQGVRMEMQGRFKTDSPQTLKRGEGSTETMFSIDRFVKIVNGVRTVEIDIPNYIYRQNGVDIYQDIRDVLGI